MITAGRKSDAVISVCQNNDKQRLEIKNVNHAAELLLGQYNSSLKDHSFYEIITPESVEKISDYLDFEDYSSDFASVLNKTRNLEILNKNGKAIPVHIKAFYSLSIGKHPLIELLIRDISLYEKIEQIKKQLQTNRADPFMTEGETGLMSRESFIDCMKLVADFINNHPIEACIAIMAITNYSQLLAMHGSTVMQQLITEIVHRYNESTREEDVIGLLKEGYLGVILFNCSAQDAITVASRIKHKILSSPITINASETIKPEINISYINITTNSDITTLLNKCEQILSNVPVHS